MASTPRGPAALAVLDDPRRMAAVLPPLRRQILESLDQADSATGVARRLGLSRQKVNYHLRRLEAAGLVTCIGTRRRRGCTERRVRATARAIVLNPDFLGALGADPDALQDRFSSAYLMAVASRTLRDVSVLRRRAAGAGRALTTVTLQTEVAFASPADLKAFTEALMDRIASLVEQYHRPGLPRSRRYRFALGGHAVITKTDQDAARETAKSAGRVRRRGKEKTR